MYTHSMNTHGAFGHRFAGKKKLILMGYRESPGGGEVGPRPSSPVSWGGIPAPQLCPIVSPGCSEFPAGHW